MKTTKLMKADLYLRSATIKQSGDDIQLKVQEDQLKKYCEQNQITVNKVIHEIHSGSTINRPEWNEYISDLKMNPGGSGLLLFTSWDRFSRNAVDAIQMIATLREVGIIAQAIELPLHVSIPESKIMIAAYLVTIPEAGNVRHPRNVPNGMYNARKEED